eukprot:CAMPEP_0117443920 /NCGR_PEP_ID=MMETSP0759-20121206/4960_1 /TAXON_ID=63605 /ORGANISM="Percolomonas cosmopolitus, Strain WS" /LENGTH=887 /DNA_ID=CAMNT_0005235943 /DNA_START=577 /DNA_END=3240 /DNA_ORIENTATION=+
MAENIQVALRIRPTPSSDSSTPKPTLTPSPTHPQLLTLTHPTQPDKSLREFYFQKVLWGEEATQEVVYHELGRDLVGRMLEGFNTTLFAFGMTGSGKTHSIFGANGIPHGSQQGILPRAIQSIFDKINQDKSSQYKVFVSFLEIYLDQIGDLGRCYVDWKQNGAKKGDMSQLEHLIRDEKKKSDQSQQGQLYPYKKLDIREDLDKKVYVENLESVPVSSAQEAMQVCEIGVKYRATFETMLNEYSSRSHTIFTIDVFKKSYTANGEEELKQGKMNFVDLAGSERLKRSQSTSQRMKEAVNINSSLTALGNVILALYNGSPHVPYRDSKLTRILQSSLGGNSYTTLLATLDPRVENYEESLATLQFAFRCKNVRNQPQINYVDMSLADKDKRIRQLENEVNRLKKELIDQRRRFIDGTLDPMSGEDGEFAADGAGGTSRGGAGSRRRRLRTGLGGNLTQSVMDQLSNIPSDANSSEIERIKTEKKYAAVFKEKQSLKEKMKEKANAINKLHTNLEVEEKRYKSALHDIRKKQNDAVKDMKSQKVAFQTQLQDQRAQSEKALQEQRAHYEKQIAELNQILSLIPEKAKKQSENARKIDQVEQETEERLRAEFELKFDDAAHAHNKALDELRSQYDKVVARKDDEIEKLRQQHKGDTEGKKSEIVSLQEQIEYLYEYCTKVSMILLRMERGEYPIQMKANMSHVVIHQRDKPEPLQKDLLPHLKKRLVNVDEFIHEGEVYTTRPSESTSSAQEFKKTVGRYTAAPTRQVDFRKLKRPPTGRSATSRYSTGNYSFPTTPYNGSQGGTSSRPMSASASYRNHRHRTIEKAKQDMEDFNDPSRYKDLFVKEQTRYKELKVAFEALKRENQRMQENGATSARNKSLRRSASMRV